MKSNDFWLVEIGAGMGPLALGMEYGQLIQVLRDHQVDVDNLLLDKDLMLAVPPINSRLFFADETPRILRKIDVNDSRIRFGGLPVIGKRVHEILGIFKTPRKETLWCIDEISDRNSHATSIVESTNSSRELLARGTLWITSLGLGMSLRDGLIETIHLCDPADLPIVGLGTWTKEQQRLSEVRDMPMDTVATNQLFGPQQANFRKSIAQSMMLVALFVAAGSVLWWGISLQQRWDAVPEVPAVVVAVDPPPPNPLPDNITVAFTDLSGIERKKTLYHTQFLTTPKLGDEVSIKYLPNSPETVLGPVGFRDVGFSTAFPYGIGILAIGSALQLIVSGAKASRRRKTRHFKA
jgi:hypothetical protein